MARRCVCRGLAPVVLHDPRMRLLPLAARALFMLLGDALAALPEPGVARVGGRPLSLREIAFLVSVSGTDDETHLENLIGNLVSLGFVNRLDDGALAMQNLSFTARGADTSRRNGAAGGRPRRGETPETARLRRAQTSLAMPIAGGRTEARETQETWNPETSHAGARTAAACLDSQAKEASKQAAIEETQPDALAIANEVAEVAGMDAARSMHDARPVMTWLAEGVAPELILEIVAKIAARPGYVVPRSLGYFSKAVREAAELVRPAPAVPVDAARAAASSAYLAAWEAWKSNGREGSPPAPPPILRQVAA